MGPGFVDVLSEITDSGNAKDQRERNSGVPRHKGADGQSGRYAIQGWASRWISKIEGDYFNVVGLPVSLVYRMLKEHGALC